MQKITIAVLAALALAMCGVTSVKADITITNVTSLTLNTNWAAIPYGSYRTDTKQFGGGAAILYGVTPYVWAGLRAETFGGAFSEAGVQAQLQTTIHWNSVSITPFVEASTGMGKSTLYASAGPGALVSLHTWKFSNGNALNLGLIGDYEHVVNGSQNWNQVNAGLFLRFTF